ncbi:hypothetical protein F7725_021119 [Dissostichus mawsoni]|uniref:Serpin domain-containing protein n=1 Tax=Dissostichus mawsoni TaxID=36200 RepID=A0A7J5YGI4_DISMA|nr:hypothetical protein F7725_021119 [Dissostichus mawsoni]
MEDVHWTNQCTGGAWSAANDQASSCGSGGEQQRDTSIHQTKHHLSLSVVRAAMLILDVFSPLLLLLLFLLPRYSCRAADIPEDTTAEFSVRLYHRLQAAGDQDNIVFSPLSVALALGMVELGARGASLEEIRQAVGFSHLLPGVEFSLLQNLTAALSEDNAHYVIRFANSLLLQEGITFNPEFLHLMKKYFQADVETVDFSESAAVADQINTWVENHTESEGSWKNQFRPENTRTFSFSRDDGSEVQTLMMYQQGDFYYGSDGSQEAGGVYQVLEMPYEGEDMSMLIVLPRQEVPLASLEPIFKAALLEEWANNVKRQKVEVYMPRFKVEQKIDLRSTLQDLGIKNIFTNDADLSAMTDGKDLHIGKAVQKAYLEVTEEGAEGAVGSGTILFMGRVMTPEVVDPNDQEFDSM